jgi:hypothetical protein
VPLDKPTAEALATVAIACRPTGAPRWDAAGILAALRKVHHLEAGEVAATVVRAACDPSLDTPAAIGNLAAPCWRPATPNPHTGRPHPPRADQACFHCGNWTHKCQCDGGPTPRPTTPRTRPADNPQTQAIIANIRTQLAGTTKPRESDLSDEQDPDHTNPHGDPANAPSPPKNHA